MNTSSRLFNTQYAGWYRKANEGGMYWLLLENRWGNREQIIHKLNHVYHYIYCLMHTIFRTSCNTFYYILLPLEHPLSVKMLHRLPAWTTAFKENLAHSRAEAQWHVHIYIHMCIYVCIFFVKLTLSTTWNLQLRFIGCGVSLHLHIMMTRRIKANNAQVHVYKAVPDALQLIVICWSYSFQTLYAYLYHFPMISLLARTYVLCAFYFAGE